MPLSTVCSLMFARLRFVSKGASHPYRESRTYAEDSAFVTALVQVNLNITTKPQWLNYRSIGRQKTLTFQSFDLIQGILIRLFQLIILAIFHSHDLTLSLGGVSLGLYGPDTIHQFGDLRKERLLLRLIGVEFSLYLGIQLLSIVKLFRNNTRFGFLGCTRCLGFGQFVPNRHDRIF